MCIAIFKPKGVQQIKKTILQTCWDNNDDGAGYSFWNETDKLWEVRKGFMEWEDFWESFNSNNFNKGSMWAAHFRIATAGNTDGGNTHPFPVSSDFDGMRKTEFKSENIVYHNGVVGKGEGKASDTMVFIKEFIYPLHSLLNKQPFVHILKTLCEPRTSRWLITQKNTVHLFGEWEKVKGVSFSNTSYKKPKIYSYSSNNNYMNSYIYHNYNWNNEPIIIKPKKTNNKRVCPACEETEFIGNSIYGKHNLMCYHCGAVFDETIREVKFFEPTNFVG